jgi:hypothetical protein
MATRAIERVGFLDENFYPAYHEDIDYMWRAHLEGLANEHEFAWKFDHVNGGSTRNANQKAIDQYVYRMMRGDSGNYLWGKYGNCSGLLVWSHAPPSAWRRPYNSSGVPNSYWALDPVRRACVAVDYKQAPRMQDHGHVCAVDAGPIVWVHFPDALIPQHVDLRERDLRRVRAESALAKSEGHTALFRSVDVATLF